MTKAIINELNAIKGFEGRFLKDTELDFVMESDAVLSVEHRGESGAHPGYGWFSAELVDGDKIFFLCSKRN